MMKADQEPRTERRSDYVRFLSIPTRWTDNDAYGRVGGVVCYAYFDTVINEYLIREGGLDIQGGPVAAYAVETTCRFHRTFSFPDTIDAGLRVGQLGSSSVRYEIGLFRKDEDKPAATGHFVHVFVARETDKPVMIPDNIRASLVKLLRQS